MKSLSTILLLLCYGWATCASGKRLITFGDSITDNGNGTNSFVQAYFSKLLGQNVTAVSSASDDTTSRFSHPLMHFSPMPAHAIHDFVIGVNRSACSKLTSSVPVGRKR